MCECMHVCMHICMYACMCICIYVYMYICIYVYMYMYICIYVYMYICIYVCMYVCMYVYMYICIYVYHVVTVPNTSYNEKQGNTKVRCSAMKPTSPLQHRMQHPQTYPKWTRFGEHSIVEPRQITLLFVWSEKAGKSQPFVVTSGMFATQVWFLEQCCYVSRFWSTTAASTSSQPWKLQSREV